MLNSRCVLCTVCLATQKYPSTLKARKGKGKEATSAIDLTVADSDGGEEWRHKFGCASAAAAAVDGQSISAVAAVIYADIAATVRALLYSCLSRSSISSSDFFPSSPRFNTIL